MLSLDFQAGVFGLRSLSLSLGEGAHLFGARRRGPWRPQLPGSERDRRHDRAAMRGLRRVLSLDFQAGIFGLRSLFLSLAKGPTEFGARRRGPWRPQLPGSERDRRHDRAAMRGLRRVLSLDFQAGIFGLRSLSLSLGEGAHRIRRSAPRALAPSAAG